MTQSPNPIHQLQKALADWEEVTENGCQDWPEAYAVIDAARNLATQPPAAPVAAVREAVPLTEAQIEQGRADYGGERFDFTAGVQFAEKFHGILPAASMEADPFLQTR